MRLATAASVFLLLLVSSAEAVFTDFSDYTNSEVFAFGETFSSRGLSFKAIELLGISNPVQIFATTTHANLNPGPGIEFLFPAGIQEVSLTFSDGAGIAITINGIEPSYPSPGGFPHGFEWLDGNTLGGVLITTFRDIPPPMGPGYLKLSGPIHSLQIAGLELIIDDISVRVPEPSTTAILLAGIVPALLRRR